MNPETGAESERCDVDPDVRTCLHDTVRGQRGYLSEPTSSVVETPFYYALRTITTALFGSPLSARGTFLTFQSGETDRLHPLVLLLPAAIR